ncbi:MAG TPA: phosphatase PAP2 family protein [Sulfurovum sp.]|uniref:phosphatase PAP2 family protein n=1 Tax=Sulfurovum sp. TaxID=1969726 RepID=UPI002F953A6C
MKYKLFSFLFKNKAIIGVNLLGSYLFAKMAEDVIEKEYVVVIDRWISMHINAVQTPLFNTVMLALTNFNGTIGISVFSAGMVLWFLSKKWYEELWFYLVSVVGANAAFVTVKMIVQRLRPDSELLSLSTYSFPSGHATMATAMAMAVYFIFSQRVHRVSVRVCLLALCISWIVLISFSRVYLDVHWLSDVIAGIGLGLFWVSFVVLVKRFMHTV